MKLLFRRILFELTHPDWHRMDRHKPNYHQSCDITSIQYSYGDYELGSTYEVSLNSNVSYEGFVGSKGLFVSTPKYTYWQPSTIVVPQQESKQHSKNGWFHFQWGDR